MKQKFLGAKVQTINFGNVRCLWEDEFKKREFIAVVYNF